jgi:hypothetical protein
MAGEQKDVEVNGITYVVSLAKADEQWKILQTVSKYGLAGFLQQAGSIAADPKSANLAIMSAVTAMIVNMPYEEQTTMIDMALSNTFTHGADPQQVIRAMFSGNMPSYLTLGVKAVEHQLGDFSPFLNLMPKSTVAADQEKI